MEQCNHCLIGRVEDERCTRCGVEQPASPEEPAPAVRPAAKKAAAPKAVKKPGVVKRVLKRSKK